MIPSLMGKRKGDGSVNCFLVILVKPEMCFDPRFDFAEVMNDCRRLVIRWYWTYTLIWAPYAPWTAEGLSDGPRFIWLMQAKEAVDLAFLRSEHSDAIQVNGLLALFFSSAEDRIPDPEFPW